MPDPTLIDRLKRLWRWLRWVNSRRKLLPPGWTWHDAQGTLPLITGVGVYRVRCRLLVCLRNYRVWPQLRRLTCYQRVYAKDLN